MRYYAKHHSDHSLAFAMLYHDHGETKVLQLGSIFDLKRLLKSRMEENFDFREAVIGATIDLLDESWESSYLLRDEDQRLRSIATDSYYKHVKDSEL